MVWYIKKNKQACTQAAGGWSDGCCSSNQKSLAKRRGVGGPAKCQMSEFDMRVTYQWQLLH